MDQDHIPAIPLDLIQYLSKLYPDQVPNINDSERNIWLKVGQVSVIRKLRQLYEEQNENTLDSQVLHHVHVQATQD